MELIIIGLIIWFVISRNKKNKKGAQRGTVSNGKRIDTAVVNANSYQRSSAYYKQTALNANGQRPVQNNNYQQRSVQNNAYQQRGKQQELKRRLQQKYVNAGKQQLQGNTYQKPVQQAEDILSRAKSNVQENVGDNLKNKMLQESGGGTYTAAGVMKVVENIPAEQTVYDINGYSGLVNINRESDILKQVNDLIVTGYSGDLSFDRDFVAEGIEMLNRCEL